MASLADSFDFLSDRVHAVRVALSPVESGLRFSINDLESRLMDTCNALKRLETDVKNPPGGLLSPENADSEIKKYSRKQVDASSKMDVIRRFHDSSHHFSVLTDKFQFKSLKTCFEKPDSTSLDKAKTSHQKKKHAFLLERSLLVGLEALIQGIKELNERSRVIGEKISDTSPASKSLPSHVDFLKIAKGLIKGRQDEFNGFLSNIRFARVPQLSGLVGEHSSVKDEGEFCSSIASNEEHKRWLVPLNIRNALLSIPLSNVERLKSTLSIAPIVELIELVPHLGQTWKDHPEKKKDYPDKKKLFCVQDFFRYTRSEATSSSLNDVGRWRGLGLKNLAYVRQENNGGLVLDMTIKDANISELSNKGKRFFEELDRDGDGQITLEDLVVAMKKRRLSKRYAQEFFRCTRKHRFSKSIDWKQFLSLMEQRERTILRAYTTLCLSNSGTLQKNQVLTPLRSAGLPVNEYNAVAMIRYLNASKEGFISYRDFRNFMLLLPKERLLDDPRCVRDKPIYHERQRLQFCLLHALNNLFQEKDSFTRVELDTISEKLDHGNPDEGRWTPLSVIFKPHHNLLTGNYDANVLIAALEARNKSVFWHDRRIDACSINLSAETLLGLLINIPVSRFAGLWRSRHWISIGCIDGIWYNLDSDLAAPKSFCNSKELTGFLNLVMGEGGEVLLIMHES